MAQTILEIYDEMIAEKQTMNALNGFQPNIDSSQTLLADLTTASKVGVWRLMFFVMAVAIWTVQGLFDEHKEWIEARASQLYVGSPLWYQERALEFQYGDSLVLINKVWQYAAVNPSLQIVKLVSVNEVGGQLYLKVAKLDSNGDPEELTAPELAAFQQYMAKIKFAGFIITSISRPADLLRIHYRVYIDPLVMNINGELISNPSIKPVEKAIKDYCKGLAFDGIYAVTTQTDRIQQAQGVIDPVFETASAQYGVNPFVNLGDYYNPNAGYLKIDPLTPLSDTITYLVQ